MPLNQRFSEGVVVFEPGSTAKVITMAAAIVTAGGVSLKEIDPRTMQSRLVKGLYFCGEVMDLDADTGGYNLQAAFSTGYVAGESATGFIKAGH